MGEREALIAALVATGRDSGDAAFTAAWIRWTPGLSRSAARDLAHSDAGLDSGDLYGRHPDVEDAAEALWARRWRVRLYRRLRQAAAVSRKAEP